MSSASQQNSICKICGDKASGVHYGVISCEACKGFFKRTSLRETKYRCYLGGACAVTPQNKNKCKSCRYNLCLKQGMTENAIKTWGPVKHKKESTKNDLPNKSAIPSMQMENASGNNTTNSQSSSIKQPLPGYQQGCENNSTPTSKALKENTSSQFEKDTNIEPLAFEGSNFFAKNSISSLTLFDPADDQDQTTQKTEFNDEQEKVVHILHELETSCKTLFKQTKRCRNIVHKHLTKEHELPYTEKIHTEDSWSWSINNILKVAANHAEFSATVPGFNTLPVEDQKSLLKKAYMDIWMLSSLDFFIKGESFLVLGVDDDDYGRYIYHASTIRGIMGEEFCDDFFQLCDDFRELGLSDYELTMIAAIQLFDTDIKKKEICDPTKVKCLQEALLDALSYYMRKTYPLSGNQKLIKILKLIQRMIELNLINYEILKKITLPRSVSSASK